MSTMSLISLHNQTIMSELEPGDIVKFPRRGYDHYALYAGNGRVIHRGENGDGGIGFHTSVHSCSSDFNKAEILEESFFKVAGRSKAEKSNKDQKANPIGYGMEIVSRARTRLGEAGYNLVWKNCEHFVTWCRYDDDWSDQVEDALGGLAIGVGVGLVVGGLALLGSMINRSNNKN